MKFKFFLVFLLAVALLSSSQSYSKPRILTPLLNEKGHHNEYIKKLAKDSNGFLWVMSSMELMRFDGYMFDSVLDGILDRVLFIDSADRVWISGIYRMNLIDSSRNKISVFEFSGSVNKEKKNKIQAYDVNESKNGSIVIAAEDGIYLYLEESSTLKRIEVHANTRKGVKPTIVRVVEFIDENTLLLGTEHGAFDLELEALTDSIEKKIVLDNSFGTDEGVTSITKIDSNQYVFLHSKGFTYYNSIEKNTHRYKNTDKYKPLRDEKINTVAVLNSKQLLLGSDNGLEIFDLKIRKFYSGSLFFVLENEDAEVKNIHDIHIFDEILYLATLSGIFWTPLFSGELDTSEAPKYSPKLNKYEAEPFQNIKEVWSIDQSLEYGLSLGTIESGVYFLDDERGIARGTKNSGELNSNRVSSLFVDKSGGQWVGAGHGLSYRKTINDKLKPLMFSTKNFPDQTDNIRSISQAEDSTIWVLSVNWLAQLESPTKVLKIYDFFGAMHEANCKQYATTFLLTDGVILVGCENGLVVMNRHTGKYIKKFDTSIVMRILKDKQSNVWVLEEKTLYIFDEEHLSLTPLESQDFFDTITENAYINFAEDQYSQIWVAYTGGVFVIDAINKVFLANFGESSEFQNLKPLFGNDSMKIAESQEILIGDVVGLLSIESMKLNIPASPEIAISKIIQTSGSRSQTEREPVTLASAKNNTQVLSKYSHELEKIEFEFTDLDIKDSRSTLYQYYLEGTESYWNKPDKKRTVSYLGLKSGKYTLHVRSLKNLQYSGELVYSFVISPHPLLSLSAIIFYVFSLIMLFEFLLRLRGDFLQRKVDLLELKVFERTKVLISKNSDIEQLLKDKETMMENIFHQTRTPIQLIIANMDELKIGEVEIPDYIEKQAGNIHNLVELTDRVLNIGQYGDDILFHQNLDSLISQYIEKYTLIANKKGIKFFHEITPPINLVTNANLMSEIVDNILSNGVKYTKTGYVKIFVKIDNDRLLLSVEDTGIGISTENTSRVLQRGYRAVETVPGTGSGIGLAIVQENISRLGGEISIKNKVNQGTVVHLEFPVCDNSVNKSSESTLVVTNEDQSQDNSVQIKEKSNVVASKILLVEDNVELANYYLNVLNSDYIVKVRHSGEDAIESAICDVPDIVISDVMMGEVSGFDVVIALRKNLITRHIPLILLTAKADQRSKLEGFNVGANDYIIKPVHPHELLLRVQNQLNLVRFVESRALLGSINEEVSIQSDEMTEKYLDVMQANFSNAELRSEEIAEMLNITKKQLERKVKQVLGTSPKQCLIEYRLNRSKILLSQGKKVSRVYEACGFSSHAYFTKKFKEKYGYPPSTLTRK